jgi:hypothetical protein
LYGKNKVVEGQANGGYLHCMGSQCLLAFPVITVITNLLDILTPCQSPLHDLSFILNDYWYSATPSH